MVSIVGAASIGAGISLRYLFTGTACNILVFTPKILPMTINKSHDFAGVYLKHIIINYSALMYMYISIICMFMLNCTNWNVQKSYVRKLKRIVDRKPSITIYRVMNKDGTQNNL